MKQNKCKDVENNQIKLFFFYQILFLSHKLYTDTKARIGKLRPSGQSLLFVNSIFLENSYAYLFT